MRMRRPGYCWTHRRHPLLTQLLIQVLVRRQYVGKDPLVRVGDKPTADLVDLVWIRRDFAHAPGQGLWIRFGQPPRHAMLDRLRHAAKVRTEQRPACRLGIRDDEWAGIVPDGWRDHDVHLPVELVGR